MNRGMGMSMAGAKPGGGAAWRTTTLARVVFGHPRAAVAAGAVLAAAFGTAWLLIQQPNFFSGYDFVRMHSLYKGFYRQALLEGRLPLWNPYVGLGRPFLADIETASFYPPNALVLVFGVYGGVALSVLLHQALAFYGGVRLGGVLGASRAASWIVGGGSALGSAFTARLAVGIVEGYFTLCWLPVLLWLGAELQDRWDRRRGGAFGAACALAILAGQPPLLFVVGVGLVAFLVFRQRWPVDSASRHQVLRNGLGILATGALGVAAASATLLPFAELVGQGNRPLNAPSFAQANGMPAPSWLSLLVPASAGFTPNWEYGLYCGLVPLFAAWGGLTLWRERNGRALLGLGLVGALLAAGDRGPFFRWIAPLIPGAGALRIPSRYGILFAAALLGLAALSLSERRRRPFGLLIAGLAVALAWLIWLEPYVAHAGGDPWTFYALNGGAAVIAALLVGLWQGRERWPGATAALGTGLALFCAANWLWAIRVQAPVYSSAGFRTRDAAVRAALERAGLFSRSLAPPRLSFDPSDVRENAGMAQGFSTYDSYVAPSLRRTWAYVHAMAGVPTSDADYIQLPTTIHEHWSRLDGMNLAASYDHASQRLVVRDHPDPRAYVVFARESVPDWRAALALMASRRDFRKTALVETGTAPLFSAGPGPHAGTANIVGFAPERVEVETVCDAPAILVLAEAWYPGWRGSVDGVPTGVFPVNGWMRGVVVPAGRHRSVFTFRSRLLPLGLALSAAGVAALAVLGLAPGRRAPVRAA